MLSQYIFTVSNGAARLGGCRVQEQPTLLVPGGSEVTWTSTTADVAIGTVVIFLPPFFSSSPHLCLFDILVSCNCQINILALMKANEFNWTPVPIAPTSAGATLKGHLTPSVCTTSLSYIIIIIQSYRSPPYGAPRGQLGVNKQPGPSDL